jgi:hypothetical protein
MPECVYCGEETDHINTHHWEERAEDGDTDAVWYMGGGE